MASPPFFNQSNEAMAVLSGTAFMFDAVVITKKGYLALGDAGAALYIDSLGGDNTGVYSTSNIPNLTLLRFCACILQPIS